jgi:mannose-6-phosphate isomerase-like protein (cupin superfamily)
MLETFDWSGDVVFSAPHATVIAANDPCWNLLGAFAEPGGFMGFVLDGYNATLRHNGFSYSIPAGTYFAINTGDTSLTTPGGRILLIYQPRADYPFMLGGPIESMGRLRYIDGCTDSLLIPPWRLGEACLNLLHIPLGVEQTMHTHPSDRIGVVVSGRGQCITPEGTTDLQRGVLWRIPAGGLHRFRTDDEALRIVAWHPSSEWGPTDETHPMVRSTLVAGVSAEALPEIRTRLP